MHPALDKKLHSGTETDGKSVGERHQGAAFLTGETEPGGGRIRHLFAGRPLSGPFSVKGLFFLHNHPVGRHGSVHCRTTGN